ncbi:MAG TPA: metallophosphoesterase N-terminal domain-containing protein, partial [Candidatus Sumerlaeota bacterium]|nr:metallophosphoesterase N-terminal domain-containing protein [Candidatus Sumerlaeota bacterium]
MFHDNLFIRRVCLPAIAALFLIMFAGARAAETPSAPMPMPFPFPIRGVVFEDINKNNKRDEGEPLLSGIPVSDGNDIVFTGEDGAFLLPNTDQKAKTVFVCVPSGFEKTGRFFQILLGLSAEQRFDFPLRRSAPGAG